MGNAWTVERMLELGRHHAAIETERDLEGTLATLVPEPVYEFWPMGWRMVGMDPARRYYEHLMGSFMPSLRGFEMIEEWASPSSVTQEYSIEVAVDGAAETHRVIGVLFYGDDEHLGGERIWASERCVRLMAGDGLIDEISAKR